MVPIGRSARYYLERRDPAAHPTRRSPLPRLVPEDEKVHTLPLSPPLPLPELLDSENYSPPVVSGATTPWPHGEVEI